MSGVILRSRRSDPEEDEYEEDFFTDPTPVPVRPVPPRTGRRLPDPDSLDNPALENGIQLDPLHPDLSDGSSSSEISEKPVTDPIQDPDKDTGLLYFALVVCGLGILLPFNCFTLATDYYSQRFAGTMIIFNINMTYLVSNLVGVLFGNLFIETIAFPARVMGSLGIALTALLFVTIFDMLLELFDSEKGYNITLAACAISGFCCSVSQTGIYGYTSMLPMRYTQAVMTGESISGTVVSIARVITKAVMFHNLALSSAIFFGVVMGVLLLAILLFHVSRQTELATRYVSQCQEAARQEMLQKTDEKMKILQRGGSQTSQNSQKGYGTSGDSKPKEAVTDITPLDVSLAVRNRCKVVHDLWPYVLGIALTYCVTASLYPAILDRIETTIPELVSWWPIILFSIYNVFDLVGKVLSSLGSIWNGVQLMLWALSRSLLAAAILLCIMPLGHPILEHEAYAAVFSFILGITNGYLGSICMMKAGTHVEEGRREVAGNIMTLALCTGLACGSGLSYFWNWVINLTDTTV